MIFGVILAILLSILFVFYAGYYIFGLLYGKRKKNDNGQEYLPTVSMVTATFNEEKIIKRKIENTLKLDYPTDKLEWIFIDSSDDETRNIINDFKKKSKLKIVLFEENERKGLATALNKGYELATGEVVVKSDCDILLNEKAVREIVKPFSDPNVGAVSGAINIINQANLEIGYRSIFERLRLAEANLDSTYLFNPFSAFRKEAIQPIDPKSVADDAELALKIRKKDYRTVYAPEAISYEKSPTSIRERIKQKSRRAQGHIRLISQNLRLLLNPKYGKFGTIIFPANFFMMIISPWLMILTLFIGFLYLASLFGILVSSIISFIFIVLIIAIYLLSRPAMVAGFLDSQLNLVVGFAKLAIKGPDFKWAKDKR
ncbi:MAG: glycosyltransferase [Candidatus Bathyarchaeota archaeon]|jgi:cellulose synthase/poly-beta-1,6-N-acetylglucosamine synthase-like glycosyltransferase